MANQYHSISRVEFYQKIISIFYAICDDRYYSLNFAQVLNALNATCEVPMDDTICVSNLDSKDKIDPGILKKEADIKFYLPVGFEQYTLQEVFEPNHYRRFMGKLDIPYIDWYSVLSII